VTQPHQAQPKAWGWILGTLARQQLGGDIVQINKQPGMVITQPGCRKGKPMRCLQMRENDSIKKLLSQRGNGVLDGARVIIRLEIAPPGKRAQHTAQARGVAGLQASLQMIIAHKLAVAQRFGSGKGRAGGEVGDNNGYPASASKCCHKLCGTLFNPSPFGICLVGSDIKQI
jgi:hypothetical protein